MNDAARDHIEEDGRIILVPIGKVHSPLSERSEDLPFQSFASDIEGTIELFEEYEPGLEGIERFSHITVLYYMHSAKYAKLRTVPFMEEEETGVFGTRSPSRPNHMGISTVRLLSHRDRFLEVRGLDMFDGTPVIDIKPYVPRVDLVKDANHGWLQKKLEDLKKRRTE